ncbi:hypothetical protein C8J57DRAFT_1250618 [Mycena rebaudengoi]|nr:hypothetical protein C8J57DRAFT_1250618 [Mycena rebaudengoi]
MPLVKSHVLVESQKWDKVMMLRRCSYPSSVALIRLRHLAIHCDAPSAQDLTSIFKTVPVLRTLRILTNPHAFLPLSSYPALNSLELNDISVPILLNAFVQFPRLSHLKARLSNPANMIARPQIHTAPYRQSHILDTYCGYPAPVDPMLDWLTLPNLRRLEIHHELQFNVLSSFLTRASWPRDHDSRADRGVATYMAAMLSHHIAREEYILEFMVTLTLHVNQWPGLHLSPLPRLRALTVATWKLDFPHETLFYYLRDTMNRRRHPLPLQSFHLKLRHDPTGNDRIFWLPGNLIQAELGRIVAEGLDIQITTPDDHLNWPDELNCRIDVSLESANLMRQMWTRKHSLNC